MKSILLAIALISFAGCLDAPGTSDESQTAGESGSSGQSGAAEAEKSAAIVGQGQVSGSDSRTLDCEDGAEVDVGIQGQGGLDVTVTDGNGDEVYSKSFDGQGQSADNKTPSGASGTWTLDVEFTGSIYYPQGFQGQWAITLRC